MPVLKNTKHELFAQALAEGISQKLAYELAGYEPDEPHASRLASNGKVQDRVAELKAAVAERTEVTIESLIREAAENQRIAKMMGQIGAANGALKLKAVFAGLYVEKSDNTNTTKSVRELTDEEIASRLAELRRGRASNGDGKPSDSSSKLN